MTVHRLPRLALLGPMLALGSSAGCTPAPEPADLVLVGGKIVTLEPAQAEVEALAARGGVIVALGRDAEVRRHVGPGTRVIDLAGHLVVPGFIEGHAHFTGIGEAKGGVDLTGAASWDEVVERVFRAAGAARPGGWIVGRGWHQEEWKTPPEPAVEGYPVHAALSRAVPDRPVLLWHASGHAAVVNARALALAGIQRDSSDPPGGRILRDARGEPTGVLREAAASLARAAYEQERGRRSPEEREADERRKIELADRECLAHGITSFQDAGSSFETVDRLRELAAAGRLGVRLWVMLGEDDAALAARGSSCRILDAGDRHLTVRAIKRYADGALGSHGAWLLEPYDDLPGTSGLNATPREALERTAELALAGGFQLCVHAIGDRANREVLDVYEEVFRRHGGRRDLRWRIEHAQHLAPADVPRFAGLGVIASMQAIHCTSDAGWVVRRLGPRRSAEGAYVWRKLLDAGAVVSNGTDAPVEEVDPLRNFYAAVTRRTPGGEAFQPEQRMTRMEALRAATWSAAYAAFEETVKGSLAPGKLADVTVLSEDILTAPEERILDAKVLYTIVGGRVLHEGGDR